MLNYWSFRIKITWQRCVCLSSFGSDAIVPPRVWVMDESAQVIKQLWEGRVAGLVYRVVEQRGPPQCGVLAEEHAVDASQPLFSGIDRPQAMFFSAYTAAPWLVTIVDASEVMCTWVRGAEGQYSLRGQYSEPYVASVSV